MPNVNPYINYDMLTVTRKIDTLKDWIKYNKNPKYCTHNLGYWHKMTDEEVCITCGYRRIG